MPKGGSQPNRPETYLTPEERALVNRLLGFPEEFPHKFIAWLDDHLKVNVPQFPVTQISGFQDFKTTVEQFLLGQGDSWTFIDAKGDLIVGYANDTITTLPVGNNNYVLTADSNEASGMKWAVSSASALGEKYVQIPVTDPNGSAITTGDGKAYFTVGDELNGLNVVDADASVVTVSSSGAPTIQIHNVTQAADMLSTRITIDANENTSYTAATAPVIDTANDDVATGDILRVDVDVAGTGAKGLSVLLTFG